MNLLSSWYDSLLIFKPRNFVSFIKQSYRIFIATYKKCFLAWWWAMLIVPILFILTKKYMNFFAQTINTFWIFGFDIFSIFKNIELDIVPTYLALCGFLISIFNNLIISSRPEAKKEDIYTYSKFYWQSIYYSLWFLILPFLWKFGWPSLWKIFSYFLPDITKIGYMNFFGFIFLLIYVLGYVFLITAFNLFFGFFIFDSNNRLKDAALSFMRGLKMVIYSIPFCILMGCVLFILGFVIPLQIIELFKYNDQRILWANTVFMLFQIFLFLPILISIGRQFYIQRRNSESY